MIQAGARVRTASQLSGDGWSEHHRAFRCPGAVGVARELHTPLTTAEEPWWIVEHSDGSRGCYHAAELFRLPASTAGEQTPLEQRVAKLEQELAAFRVAMADELAGLEAAAEQPRVRTSELQALRGLRRAVEGYRQYFEGTDTAPEIVGALQTLDEIDAGNDDPIPEIPAPPPSDAGEEVIELRRKLWEALHPDEDPDSYQGSEPGELVAEVRRRVAKLKQQTEYQRKLRVALDNGESGHTLLQLARIRVEEAQRGQGPADLRAALTVDEPSSAPLLELAQRRAQEGALHRELLRRVGLADLGSLVQGLEQLDASGGPASVLASCLAPLLGPAADPPEGRGPTPSRH